MVDWGAMNIGDTVGVRVGKKIRLGVICGFDFTRSKHAKCDKLVGVLVKTSDNIVFQRAVKRVLSLRAARAEIAVARAKAGRY
jgi:hypothetical protein